MEEEGGGGGPPPPLWPPSLHGRWPRGHTRRCTPPRTTERSNGRSAAGAETRGDSGELRAPSAPSLLAARAGGGRRAPWRRRRRWDSRCPEDVQRDNTLFVDPAATSRRTARFSSPLPLLLFSSLSFRSSFSPFIRPSWFHPLSAPWYSSSDSLRAFLFRSF